MRGSAFLAPPLVPLTPPCKGGELFDKVLELKYYTEEVANRVTLRLLDALVDMHDRGHPNALPLPLRPRP